MSCVTPHRSAMGMQEGLGHDCHVPDPNLSLQSFLGRSCSYLWGFMADVSITRQSLAFWVLRSSLAVGGISAKKDPLTPKQAQTSQMFSTEPSLFSPSLPISFKHTCGQRWCYWSSLFDCYNIFHSDPLTSISCFCWIDTF